MTEDRGTVVARLERAVAMLESCREFGALVPEVRVNFACAAEAATGPEDVAAVDGRITVVSGMPRAAGPVRFGASDHMARLILELRRHDPGIRAGLNFRWHETILEFVKTYCQAKSLELGSVDRSLEPAELVGRDQGSMAWKVASLVGSCQGRVPPVFYESRGLGKEPLFVLVGRDPVELAQRAVEIARGFAAGSRPRADD